MNDSPSITFVRIAPFISFSNYHPQDTMWPMIMAYSGAILLEKGMRVNILDTWAEPCSLETLQERIRETNPEFVILEADSPAVDFAKQLALRLKTTLGIPLWACGQHASILPMQFCEKRDGTLLFDGCLFGEYDAIIERFVGGLRQGTLSDGSLGIHAFDGGMEPGEAGGLPKAAQLDDLDSLPQVPYSLLALSRYHIYSSQVPGFRPLRWGFGLTTRGCPYKCIYCSPTLRQSFGHAYRQQSAERVVEDMLEQKSRIGINAIFMEDDIFSLDRERTLQICEKLQQNSAPVPFIIQTRFDALDREGVHALKKAGCVGICAGVESASNRILQSLEKGTTQERVLEVAGEIRKEGISLTAYYVIGNPGETEEEMEGTLQLAKKIDALMIQVAFFTPYPGSPVYENLSADQQQAIKHLSHYNALAVNLSEIDEQRLQAFQKHFYKKYYMSLQYMWKYLWKRFIFAAFNNHELKLIWSTLRYLFQKTSSSEAS